MDITSDAFCRSKKMLVKVVIPVYKRDLSAEERHSLQQCCLILKNYPLALVTHPECDLTDYKDILTSKSADYTIELFDHSYFDSVLSYSRLLLNPQFYLRFKDSEYILIYQLDAFVFNDELTEWCKKGYDYIGAPWFTHYKTYEEGYKLYKAGNGGVSLRKVSTILERFEQKMPLSIFPFYIKNIRKKGFWKMFINTLKMMFLLIFTKRTVGYYLHSYTDSRINEDCFWAEGLSETKLALNIPSAIEAAHFCIEKSPSYLFDMIGQRLPFACHAYEKYEYESFWKKYIYLP